MSRHRRTPHRHEPSNRRPRPLGPALRRRAALLLTLAGLGAPALASGPVNTVLVIDPGNAQSMYLGNYYKNARGIPESNVLYLDSAAGTYTAFVNGNLKGFLGMLSQRGIEDQVDIVLVSPLDSFYVTIPAGEIPDTCFPVTRISIPSMYTSSFITADIIPGAYTSQTQQGYFSTATDSSIGFDGSAIWRQGSPSTHPAGRRFFIGASLGWTGTQGNTVPEIISMIDRSVSADGTRPAGTFYFMSNTADPDRNVRNTQYPAVVSSLTAKGAQAETRTGVLPLGEHDALGVMSGFASFPIATSDFSLVPGAFADHLTSYAAAFDIFDQTKMSEWIRKGASGTAGAIEEPCNYMGKFPHARLHLHYFNGLTLGEAWFRAQSYIPFQEMFTGDPLTRTFAYIPTATVTGFPAGPVSGTITFTPSSTTPRPGSVPARFELYVDGVFWSSSTVLAPALTLNTAMLDDGYHDVRVLSFDSSSIRTDGRWQGALTVNNLGRSATLGVVPPSGSLTTSYQFPAAAAGGSVRELRLVQNGRVIATAAAGSATIPVYGQNLGAGRSQVRVEAIYADGRIASSPPVNVDVAFSGGASAGAAPVAYSYTRRVDPSASAIIELPAGFDTDPSTASYVPFQTPAQASVIGGPNNAYVMITPNPAATGVDTMTFRVTTPNGASNLATVRLVYSGSLFPCPVDLNEDGVVDFSDYLEFLNLYDAGDLRVDFNGDGVVDFADYLEFLNLYDAGC